MGGVILGNWTHRRGDAGGCRAVAAEVAGAKPRVAWTWSPPHGGRIDQVRIAGEHVYVATLGPADPTAPGWEHAVVYALDAARGTVVGHRTLADPAPVAAMAIEGGVLHLVATRPGEPIFWYALATSDLTPSHRRLVDLDADPRHSDVLDAWATPDGGLWLEIETAPAGRLGSLRSWSFLAATTSGASSPVRIEKHAGQLGQPRDACAGGRTLFVPGAVGGAPGFHPLEPDTPPPAVAFAEPPPDGVESETVQHSIFAEGAVSVMALASLGSRTSVRVVSVDRSTGVVRNDSRPANGLVRAAGASARMARRPNGELLLQCTGHDGAPCSDLVCALPDGSLTTFKLAASRPYLLDLALGDALLAHRSPRSDRVIVGAFAVLKDGGWLGRRTSSLWSLEIASPGGPSTVYAGAGHVVVRSPRGLTGIRM